MANEKTFAIVVRVYKPADNVIRITTSNIFRM